MAISFIGSATGTNTATMPAHVAGDLIVVAAYRFSSSTAPSIPGGWTSIIATGSGTMSRTIGYKFAASSSEVVGTWTNADLLVVHVYRGVAAIGSTSTGSFGSAATIQYANITQQNNVSSWVVAFGAVQTSTTTTVENAPTGMFARQNAVGASGEIASFDTDGPYAGSWIATNVSLGATVTRVATVLELLESPRAVTMQPGSYALSGANTPVIRPSPISFIGAANGTNTATLPAHQVGDLIVVAAFNTSTTTAPSLISGYTSIANSSSTNAYRYMWKVATSNSETLGTITNSTICAVVVYRGTRQTSPIGVTTTAGPNASATISYSALSLNAVDGSSWVCALGFAASSGATVENPATLMTLRTNGVVGSSEIAMFDTDGGVGAWGDKTAALGSSVTWRSAVFEIRAPQNLSISPDPGSYAISGADTNIARSYSISADPGSYMLSGADTPFIRSLLISAAPGAYALSGADTTLDMARYIFAEAGSYAISGANTALVRSLLMSADPGSYTISGAATGILRSLVMPPAPGSYALSGANTALEKGYVIFADAGSYSLNGANTSLVRALQVVAAPGSYSIGGADTPLYRGYEILADAGSYSISGSDVMLDVELSGFPIEVYRSGAWVQGRLMIYQGGAWVKPTVMRYHGGDWEEM